MKKLFFTWLLMAGTIVSFAQGKTLYSVSTVKPKAGMRSTFEANWKAHLAKYHTKADPRVVYEITTGEHSGTYLIVEGPISYADMDVKLPNDKEHALDLEKNFSPFIESNLSETYRYDDSASFHPNVPAEKFQVVVTHVKWAMINATMREQRRGATINTQLSPTSPFSQNFYSKIMAGSDPVTVTVRNLKDGLKSLESNFYPSDGMAPNAFKDAYIKLYGQADYDARQKLSADFGNLERREVYIMELRKDLSTPLK